jgi:hypothetical protein
MMMTTTTRYQQQNVRQKGYICPLLMPQRRVGGAEVKLRSFLTSALDGKKLEEEHTEEDCQPAGFHVAHVANYEWR